MSNAEHDPNHGNHERTYISEADEQAYRRLIAEQHLRRVALRARYIPDWADRMVDPMIRNRTSKAATATAVVCLGVTALIAPNFWHSDDSVHPVPGVSDVRGSGASDGGELPQDGTPAVRSTVDPEHRPKPDATANHMGPIPYPDGSTPPLSGKG